MTQDEVPRNRRDGLQSADDILEIENDEDSELVETLNSDNAMQEDSDDEVEEEEESDDEYKPERDDAIVTYDRHTAPVYGCKLSPNGKLAGSGSEDETFHIWDSQTGVTKHVTTSFQDSVIVVEFSADGKYVAAGDMYGTVVVLKISEAGLSEIYSETVPQVNWMQWHRQINVLLVGTETSVWMIKVPSGQVKVFQTQPIRTEAGSFMPDGKRAAIGYKDGSVEVINLTSGKSCCKFSPFERHLLEDISVVCLDVHPNNDLLAVGSINSQVALFTTKKPKILGTLSCINDRSGNDMSQHELYENSIETVGFCLPSNDLKLLLAGTDSTLHIIDYSRMQFRSSIHVPEGLTIFICVDHSRYVFAGTKTGPVNVYDVVAGTLLASLLGHSNTILEIAYCKADQTLITASDDNKVKVFKDPIPIPINMQ